ncbi:phospholipase D-like domain-containing protein [Buchananella felis]|uniref:phospholipase D-like domain-containing protein n=1 Tax=Buchananella felis TaxID=3231492 RepID=UPI003528CE35
MTSWRYRLARKLLTPPSPRTITRAAKWWIGSIAAAQAVTLATVMINDHLRKRRKFTADSFLTGPPEATSVAGNCVTTYTDARALYEAMLASIRAAKHHIYFETYIWKSDEWGEQFKHELIQAAKRGVDVRIIYDAFGNWVVDPRLFAFPKMANLHVLRFPTFNWGMLSLSLRHFGRDHRKILVVDGVDGYTGGYNIGSLYHAEWRDTHVRVQGEGAWELENAFVDFWNEHRRGKLPALPDAGARSWNARIRAAQNTPTKWLFPVRGLYIDACERATDRVWITQAYFIPDQEILDALIAAARRGVDVKVLVPEISNHVVADWVARSHYSRLLEAGVELWLYRGAMIHAKTATVDGRWSTIGTANIDRLSLRGNYEVNLEFFDYGQAQNMEAVFLRDLSQSRRLTLEEWDNRPLIHRVGERLLRPFAPLI